ncbi:hypothetical protein TTHERM_00389940 (macronuclear) [Tetrahymena thermophila SB210]|uniref:Uncharacterized protein n=1 Tax=Tetrahymena thermophila (strain SB210) TaxID=312017 RepID=Q23R94_TETTS|nr:hypothetical protein TTHERM_00389940 [Tetrahymena thermophila SB210]EAR99154.2 hypothetical protein TTHERM_00389940 [Tetrahymena thermophila SB210]|eukprot:XP_001019399.2 hypothetical protein TTHERM_00389940 [Tetrahymena thermophila SB210]
MEDESVKTLLRLAQKDEKYLIQLLNEKVKNDSELSAIKLKNEQQQMLLMSQINDFKQLVRKYEDKIQNLESMLRNYDSTQTANKIKADQDEKSLIEYSQAMKHVWNSLIHFYKNLSIQKRAEVCTLVYDDQQVKELFTKLIEYVSEDYQEFQREIGKLQKESIQFKIMKEKYQNFENIKDEMMQRHQNEIKLIEKQKENILEKNALLQNQVADLENQLKLQKQDKQSDQQHQQRKVKNLQQKIDELNQEIENLKSDALRNQPQPMLNHQLLLERQHSFDREKMEYQERLRILTENEISQIQQISEKRLKQQSYEFQSIINQLKEKLSIQKDKLTQNSKHIENLNSIINNTSTITEKEQLLLQQIKQLELQNQSLREDLQIAKDQQLQLNIQNHKLESELSHSKTLIDNLNNILQDFRTKFDHSSDNNLSKIKQLELEKDALIKQINEQNSKIVLVLEENIDRVRKEEKVKRDDQLNELKQLHRIEINQITHKFEQKIIDLKDQIRAQMEKQQLKLDEQNQNQQKMKELFEREIAKYQQQINQINFENQNLLNQYKDETLKQLETVKQEREKDLAIMKEQNDKFKERVRKRALEDVQKEQKQQMEKLQQIISEWEYKYSQVEEKLTNQHRIQTQKIISQYDQQIGELRSINENKQFELEQRVKNLQEQNVSLKQTNIELEQQMRITKLESNKCIESASSYKIMNEELIKNYEQLQNQSLKMQKEHEQEVEKLCSEIKEIKGKVSQIYEEQCNQYLTEQQVFVKNMEKSVNELQSLHKQEVRDLKEQLKEMQILFNLRPSKTEDVKTISQLQEELTQANRKINQFELEYQNMKKTYDVFKPQPQPLSSHAALHQIINNIQLNASSIVIPNNNFSHNQVITTLNNQNSRKAITPTKNQYSPIAGQKLNQNSQQQRVQSSLSNYRLNLSSTDDLIQYQQSQQKSGGKEDILGKTLNDIEFCKLDETVQSKTTINMSKTSNLKRNHKPKRIKTEQEDDDEDREIYIQNIINNNRNQSRIGKLLKEGSQVNSSLDQFKIQDSQSPLKNNLIQQKMKTKFGLKLTLQDAIQKKSYGVSKDKYTFEVGNVQNQLPESDLLHKFNTISNTNNQKQNQNQSNNKNQISSTKRQRFNTISNLGEKNQFLMPKNIQFSRKIRDEQLKCLSMTRPMSSLEFNQ